MLRRPLPWMGKAATSTVRVVLVSADTLFAEAMSVCLDANDGLDVVGIVFDPTTAARAAEVLRPTIMVFEQRSAEGAVKALADCRQAHPAMRAVLLATRAAPTQVEQAAFEAIVPPNSSLDRVVAAVRETAWDMPRPVEVAPGDPTELSPREREVLTLLAHGLGTTDMAGRLHISEHTVRNHVRRLLGKLEVHSRMEAVMTARRRGLL